MDNKGNAGNEHSLTLNFTQGTFESLKIHSKQTGFETIEEYLMFLIEEILKEESENNLTQEDEEEIKQKLRSLGYME